MAGRKRVETRALIFCSRVPQALEGLERSAEPGALKDLKAAETCLLKLLDLLCQCPPAVASHYSCVCGGGGGLAGVLNCTALQHACLKGRIRAVLVQTKKQRSTQREPGISLGLVFVSHISFRG